MQGRRATIILDAQRHGRCFVTSPRFSLEVGNRAEFRRDTVAFPGATVFRQRLPINQTIISLLILPVIYISECLPIKTITT